jgi:hypothetical protein
MAPEVSTAIHGLLGLKYQPEDKANAIADCLENQFTPHDLCVSRAKALLEATDNNPHRELDHVTYKNY